MLTCPERDCGSEQPDAGRLAAHLVQDHAVSAALAFSQAQAVKAKLTPSDSGPRSSEQSAGPSRPEDGRVATGPRAPSPVKEAPMADAITCKGCEKPFTPKSTGGRLPSYCPSCRKNMCPQCRQRGGNHAAACTRAATGARSKPKSATGGGTRRRPRPSAAVRNGAGPATTLEAVLADLRGRRATLDEAIVAIEKLAAR